MRRFLYLSPYFPPTRRVGALRPLKFVRHLTRLGWDAVVLADLETGSASDPALAEAIPESTVVVRDYGWSTARRERRSRTRSDAPSSLRPRATGWKRALALLATPLTAPFERNPELVPLGGHSLDMPHALRRARRLLDEHSCELIVVNADPYAACMVGRRLAEERSLPLIVDLRDPWALCELRRPMRPLPQRVLVDRLERAVVERSSFVVLNTETTRRAYADHYRDLPQARFQVIRNHADRSLIGGEPRPPGDRMNLVLLGHLRRFIAGDVLLEALRACRQGGLDEHRLRLTVVGSAPEQSRKLAQKLGVESMIRVESPRSYRVILGAMKEADLLVAVSHPGQQRIPAKVYDYAVSARPFVVMTDNRELASLLETLSDAIALPLADSAGLAAHIHAESERGRLRSISRDTAELESPKAAERLAHLMERALGN